MHPRHDEASRRFQTSIDGHEAYVYYTLPEDGVLDIRTTFVAPPLRNRGLGAELVRHVADFARRRGLRLRASCGYAAKILDGTVERGTASDGG